MPDVHRYRNTGFSVRPLLGATAIFNARVGTDKLTVAARQWRNECIQ